jgi:acyl-CoA synthetase (AMP-forming)/AMP-acid ligase II
VLIADRSASSGPSPSSGARSGHRRAPPEPLPATTESIERLDELLAPLLDAGTPLPDLDIDPDDNATILYTSGTRATQGRAVHPPGGAQR